jgi:hypothetical protein
MKGNRRPRWGTVILALKMMLLDFGREEAEIQEGLEVK